MTGGQARKLAELLLAGKTRKQCADELQIGLRTVSSWKKSTLVAAEMEALANRTDEVRVRDVLMRLLESSDERVALAASQTILNHRLQVEREESLPVEPPTAPEGYTIVRMGSL